MVLGPFLRAGARIVLGHFFSSSNLTDVARCQIRSQIRLYQERDRGGPRT